MATVSLIRNSVDPSGIEQDGVRVITFDATVEERHEQTAEKTSHPREGRLDVTDNIRVHTARLMLTGIVSNTPLGAGVSIASLGAIGGGVSRDFKAWASLKETLRRGEVVTVVTPIETYPNMVFLSLQITRSTREGQSIQPVMVFEELAIAKALEVEIPPRVLREAVRAGGTTETDAGRSATDTPSAAESGAGESWARQLLGPRFGG